LFDDKIGSIINELSIETHDRPTRSDLRVSEERLLKLTNGCIHQCRKHHDIIARRQSMM
jgi:G3E family GTPase